MVMECRLSSQNPILSSTKFNGTLISSYTSRTVSAAWVSIQLKSHKPIIIGCIYHPPSACQSSTLDYIELTIAKLTDAHPNAELIITGDFNRLPVTDLCSQFGLTYLVNFSTRSDAKLDPTSKNITVLPSSHLLDIMIIAVYFSKAPHAERTAIR